MTQEIQFPKVQEDVISWGRRSRTYCPNYKAIVNPETGDTYAIVSPNYKLLTHENAIETVMEVVDQSPEFGKFDISANFLKDGSRMETKITFPDVEYDIGGGDLINPTIVIKNSYDTGWNYDVRFGAFRLVCSNGLVIGEQFAHYVKRHTQSLNPQDVQRILIEGMQSFSEQIELWKTWMDRVTTSSEYEYIMDELDFSKKETNEIHNKVEISSDIMLDDIKIKSIEYWIFYNLITQFITHNVKSPLRRVVLENNVRKAFR